MGAKVAVTERAAVAETVVVEEAVKATVAVLQVVDEEAAEVVEALKAAATAPEAQP